jgi:hypothetical protein
MLKELYITRISDVWKYKWFGCLGLFYLWDVLGSASNKNKIISIFRACVVLFCLDEDNIRKNLLFLLAELNFRRYRRWKQMAGQMNCVSYTPYESQQLTMYTAIWCWDLSRTATRSKKVVTEWSVWQEQSLPPESIPVSIAVPHSDIAMWCLGAWKKRK